MVFKVFSVHKKKRKAGVCKFLQLEEPFIFVKFRFLYGLVWTAGQTVEIELRFKFIWHGARFSKDPVTQRGRNHNLKSNCQEK